MLGFNGFPVLEGACQPLPVDARSLGLGEAVTAMAAPEAGWTNPAAFAWTERGRVRLSMTIPYQLAALTQAAAQLVRPLKRTPRAIRLAAQGRTFGYGAYRDLAFEGATSRVVHLPGSALLAAGVAVEMEQERIDGYGTWTRYALSAGWMAGIGTRTHVGFAARPLLQRTRADARRARTLSMGIAHRAGREVLLLLAADHSSRHPARIRAGIELCPAPPICLRSGLSVRPQTFAAGVGFRIPKASLALGASNHGWLGWTTGLSVSLLP